MKKSMKVMLMVGVLLVSQCMTFCFADEKDYPPVCNTPTITTPVIIQK